MGSGVWSDGDCDRYLAAHMHVCEKEGYCQFEWYRGLSKCEFVSDTGNCVWDFFNF